MSRAAIQLSFDRCSDLIRLDSVFMADRISSEMSWSFKEISSWSIWPHVCSSWDLDTCPQSSRSLVPTDMRHPSVTFPLLESPGRRDGKAPRLVAADDQLAAIRLLPNNS